MFLSKYNKLFLIPRTILTTVNWSMKDQVLVEVRSYRVMENLYLFQQHQSVSLSVLTGHGEDD